MPKRASEDLEIYAGAVRSFEWYWDENDEMPGLDSFEYLDTDARAAIVAVLEHWGEFGPGKHISATRVNEENDDPKILAVKAGRHRFAMFHAGHNVWILCDYYEKQKEKLDRLGRAAIRRTIAKKASYEKRVGGKRYYERD